MKYGQKIKAPPEPGGYTSVWIDEIRSPEIIRFHCHKCGTVVFQHGGNVTTMIPDYHQSKLPLIKMCPNRQCRHKYNLHIKLERL